MAMLASLALLPQVAPARDALGIAADVSVVVIAIAVLVLLAMLGHLLRNVHRLLADLRRGVQQNLGPVSDRARAISDNVEYVTGVVRSDVASLDASVKALAKRLTTASERMEERVEEFNALMEVVQGEAEDLFIDTASTVRGVRESARTITSGRGRAARARSDADPTEEPADDAEQTDERPHTRAEPRRADGRDAERAQTP